MISILVLTKFFLWCSIINGTILVMLALLFTFFPNMLYKSQHVFFNITRESFDIIFYSILAYLKFTFLTFNLVPLVSLIIIQLN